VPLHRLALGFEAEAGSTLPIVSVGGDCCLNRCSTSCLAGSLQKPQKGLGEFLQFLQWVG
jgi:hypothetical protein